MKSVVLPVVVASGLLASFAMLSAGNAADDAEKSAADDAEKEGQSFDQELWSYLKKVEYEENYSPWPGTKDEFMPGNAPHGARLKLYVNRHVVQDPDDPPHKSLIVKENYTQEKELSAITVMYRVEDYDADNNDWYWVKYLPDGEVAKMEDTKLAGKVKGCISCHSSAKGDDYIFTNDE